MFHPAEYFEPHVTKHQLSPNCDETATSLLNAFLFSYYTISFERILLVNYLNLFREIQYRALIIR